MIGNALRSIGRALFRLADRLSPDEITTALDNLYAPLPLPEALQREFADELLADGQISQTQRDRMVGQESLASAQIRRDIERAQGGKVTTFTRRLRTLR